MSENHTKTVAVLLSGGEGRRVASADKGLLDYQGKQLVAWTIDTLVKQVDQLIISCNRNLEAYQQYQYPIVVDNFSGQGPIAGILAASQQIYLNTEDYLLVCPCDTPHLPANLVTRLQSGLRENNVSVAVVHDGHRQHNLHCLIKADSMAFLSDFFADGGRAIKHWLAQQPHCMVDFSDQTDCFKNFNTLLAFKDT